MDGPLSTLSGVFAQRYSIEKTIGRGATATVYLARDSATDRPVAIKVLKNEIAETIGGGRFLREIRLTQGLHHPRILPVLDSGEFEGKLYFVLPYMDGGTLRDRLRREHQLPFKDAVEITCTVADALAHAHEQGYVHRDVKPENILLSNGEACLADFGIARAIERSVEDTTTSTGIARGTAAYMSPEQASGAREYDGRSDIYSLGCVLYELIAGVPAFIGATPEAVIAQRFVHSPRDLKVYRATVPEKLEAVIRRAMQLSAADRYKTATELVAALRAITDADYAKAEREAKWWRKILKTPRGRVAVASLVALAIVALAFTAKQLPARQEGLAPADTTHIVLFPIEGRVAENPGWRDDDLMNQAVSRWSGVTVVDQFQVADALRRSGPNLSAEAAASIAKSLGAGRYIRGRVSSLGKSWRAYIALYDAAKNHVLYTAATQIPSDLSGASSAYSRLADSLLLRGASIDSSFSDDAGSRSLPAIQAFGQGQAALDNWNLEGADSAFQTATVFDAEYSRAGLWLAQVRAWRGLPSNTWSSVAEKAIVLGRGLTDRERHLGNALLLLAKHDYVSACGEYARLRARNNRDFTAWFGSGQCRMMDRIVVPDPTSPSKWRFRSSAAAAMAAYATAFAILPSVHRGYERGAFQNLRSLLLVSTDLRVGYGISDSAVFFGRPGWIADSLVMVPYPREAMYQGDSSPKPPGFEIALSRRRSEFRRIVAGWSAAFPQSSGAKYAVATSLEVSGDPTSIDTLELARRLEADSSKRFRLGAAEVLLLVKFGVPDDLPRLSKARLLSDSLLDHAAATIRDADAFAPLAAIGGRCSRLASLTHNRVPGIGSDNIPPSLIGDGDELGAKLALGCPLDRVTLRSLFSAIRRQYLPNQPAEFNRVSQVLLYRPVILQPSIDRGIAESFTRSSSDSMLVSINAFLTGDRTRALKAFAGVEKNVDARMQTPDITLARARMWIALGDPTRAAKSLDDGLETLRWVTSNDLRDPVRAAALIGAMIARSDLARANGDVEGFKRWSSASDALLASGDPVIKEEVAKKNR